MALTFEELAFRSTRIGDLSLRRRTELALGVEVYEIKLDDEFLMSSLFTAGEVGLADLGLAALHDSWRDSAAGFDVVVGGLGLGYTARAALADASLRSLLVIDTIPEVIEWHRSGLVPHGKELADDPRCTLAEGDFFALAQSPEAGLDPRQPGRRFHAILLDIDHDPYHVLDASHEWLYEADGLRRLAAHLHPGGVFALWSNDLPDPRFVAAMAEAFPVSDAPMIKFHNPLQNRVAENTIYIGRTGVG
jgi:hypothetical protein